MEDAGPTAEVVRRRWLERLGRPTILEFPFFTIEEAYPRGERVTVVAGELGTGSVVVGDALEAVGLRLAPIPVRVAAIERPREDGRGLELADAGRAGEVLGLTLDHGSGASPVAGQCLAPPGRLASSSRLDCDVWVLPSEDIPGSAEEHRLLLEAIAGGRGLEVFVHTRAVEARTASTWRPELGTECRLTLELELPVALYPDTRFALRYDGLVIGAGFVTRFETAR